MEDPPNRGYPLGEKGCDSVEGVKKWLEKHETACLTIREGWLNSEADGRIEKGVHVLAPWCQHPAHGYVVGRCGTMRVCRGGNSRKRSSRKPRRMGHEAFLDALTGERAKGSEQQGCT